MDRASVNNRSSELAVLAIDGGGTKTECLLASPVGRIVGYGRGGPVNLGFIDATVAKQSIEDALVGGLKNAPTHVRTVCLGATVAEEFVRPILDLHITYDTFLNVGESRACLAAGTVNEFGAVVLAGTGAFQWACDQQGKMHRTDGLGGFIGDQGSAYDLVRRALVASGRAYDGRGSETLLGRQFCEHFGVDDLRAVGRYIYHERMARHEIAALAPLVSMIADDDPVAVSILDETGHLLADGLETCVKKVGLGGVKFEVVLCGGVFNAGQPVIKPIETRLSLIAPESCLVQPSWPPVVGVLALALKEIGAQPDSKGLRLLGEQYSYLISSGEA